MPTYEYECGTCGHEFELEQPITDEPVKTCPRCKARKVRRLISQTSFVLKGGGWYSDLYSRKKSPKDDGGAAGKKDKKSAASEKGSSDKGSNGGSKSESKRKGTKAAA